MAEKRKPTQKQLDALATARETRRANAAAAAAPATPAEFLSEPDAFSDAALGIGVEDKTPTTADPLAALMADPVVASRLQAMVDAAVAARIAPVAAGGADESLKEAIKGMVESFQSMLQIQQMQMPGYFKPLPKEEVERRLEGKVAMFSLLRRFKDAGTAPAYYVGPGSFYAGAYKYEEGEPVRTFLPPPEDFVPNYDVPGDRAAGDRAREVLDAQLVWLGGSTPHISDQVAAAEEFSHGRIPLVGDDRTSAPMGPVEVIDTVKRRARKAEPAFAHLGETNMPMGHQAPPRAQRGRSEPVRGPALVE